MIHEVESARKLTEATCRCSLVSERHRIVAELDALQAEEDALKRLQAESRRGLHPALDALLPASSTGPSKGHLKAGELLGNILESPRSWEFEARVCLPQRGRRARTMNLP